jgi:hypothetical protein
MLPIAWEVYIGDFLASPNLSVYPLSGVVPVNGVQTVTLTFTSYTALMLTGKFSVRYSDTEGGLLGIERVLTRGFQVTAEAYTIQAVTLSALGSEEGGNEVLFGSMRVGDYAEQRLSIGNKGKYKIGYKFVYTRPSIGKLVTISPMEGTIEPGGKDFAAISLVFCCSGDAINMIGNKHVTVQIIEPITGELVETFPLSISAQTKYNTFRLQPSKGVTFGAIKYDSAPRTKRVEIRNEGTFDLTYVICGALSEHDELDVLDGPSYASLAQGIPPALRVQVLGEDYLSKLAKFGVKIERNKSGIEGGKEKERGNSKRPLTAAKKAADGQQAVNPLVFDPDGITTGPVAETPLVVGAFTIRPKLGIVQPGQVAGIDMTFDPNGCDAARERLRMVVSGSDMNDSLSKVVAAFDVTGDSCFPAIMTDDIAGIFEEQEIVQSLADTLGGSEGDAGSKLGKLAVGKVVYSERDRVMAWGPIMCGPQGAKGVMERIRITNPTKIDAKVKFKITSVEEAAELLAVSAGGAKVCIHKHTCIYI